MNNIETVIADINHNLECLDLYEQDADYDLKETFKKEKARLKRLLAKYEKQAKGGDI